MDFLYFLENLRVPAIDNAMLLITQLGEETAFLVAALIVFWCVDKQKGYYLMSVGFIGTMLNQFLKLICAVPRPWILDPEFTVVEGAKEAAAGYSFPSGHSQSAVGTFGTIAACSRKQWIRLVCIAVAILVPFSRMYLGVHTPADVLTGSLMAVGLVLILRPVVFTEKCGGMKALLGLMLALALGLLLYVELYPFGENMDLHNLEAGRKNAYTMVGCLTGVALVYTLEKRFVNFETKASRKVQLVKILLGLGTVLAIKEGLRSPLEMVLSIYPARAVRYFLIVMWAGIGWPSCFGLLKK